MAGRFLLDDSRLRFLPSAIAKKAADSEVGGIVKRIGKIAGAELRSAADALIPSLESEDSQLLKLPVDVLELGLLAPGDVIGIRRPAGYEHYAVYAGDEKVIHYAAEDGDFGSRVTVHEADIFDFLDGQSSFFILDFPNELGEPQKIALCEKYEKASKKYPITNLMIDMINREEYHLYTPEETLARARSRIGENMYSLALNNCEHFAIWCKTGLSRSYQVDSFMRILCDILTIPASAVDEEEMP
ncbi:MAG: lecithin retinol acyltransferase family protein [Ruminococcus sp.]|nr:lecithin retinol acyltransferase family protein [Ruminococcus sp.]